MQLRPTVDFTDLNIGVGVDSANSCVVRTGVTVNPRPPGPDVGITMNGPELTQNLWFSEGTGLSQNRYQLAVDNVGTATSANNGLTVTVDLPAGVSYRGFTTSGLTNANQVLLQRGRPAGDLHPAQRDLRHRAACRRRRRSRCSSMSPHRRHRR